MKDEILKIIVALKAVKIPISKIESELGFSNGLIGKAAKGKSNLSNDKFIKLVSYYERHTTSKLPTYVLSTPLTVSECFEHNKELSEYELKMGKERIEVLKKEIANPPQTKFIPIKKYIALREKELNELLSKIK